MRDRLIKRSQCPGKPLDTEKGFVFPAVLSMMAFFIAVGLAIAAYSMNHFFDTHRSYRSLNALAAAEAGAERAMQNLQGRSCSDINGQNGVIFPEDEPEDPAQGTGSYSVSAEPDSVTLPEDPGDPGAPTYNLCRIEVTGELSVRGEVATRRRVRLTARSFDGGLTWSVLFYEQIPAT